MPRCVELSPTVFALKCYSAGWRNQSSKIWGASRQPWIENDKCSAYYERLPQQHARLNESLQANEHGGVRT